MHRRLLPNRSSSSSTTPRWRPSVLARLSRRPWAWFAAAALLGVATFVTTNRLLGEAAAARADWTELETVVVTTEIVEAGTPLTTANTTTAELPRIALPDRTLTAVPDGATAAARLHEGEIVHPSRLVTTGTALDGHVAVAVPVGDLVGLLGVGDAVDVWAATDPFLAQSDDVTSRPLVRSATVIDLLDATALLAVNDAAVPELASALPNGSVTLTIVSRSAER